MRRLRVSTLNLTLCHVLPHERACALIERLFADGKRMSRADLLDNVLAEIGWDDELVLVRPLKVWVDQILSLLCRGGYMRRVHEANNMGYEPTRLWSRRREVMEQFQHPSAKKRTMPVPADRRRRFGVLPSDHVINLREWREVRAQRPPSPLPPSRAQAAKSRMDQAHWSFSS